MDINEKMSMMKEIDEIDKLIKNYNRDEAINLIIKVRAEHPGKEQLAYVVNTTPLTSATDEQIKGSLSGERLRLSLKLAE